jgi:hypothetical protein
MDGCKTHSRKTAAIFNLQKRIIETRARKKLRGIVEQGKCRRCGIERETVHHLAAGCSKLASTEHTRRHNNALMILVVQPVLPQPLVQKSIHNLQNSFFPTEFPRHPNGGKIKKIQANLRQMYHIIHIDKVIILPDNLGKLSRDPFMKVSAPHMYRLF